jgi:hypothetical protein
MVIPRRFIIRIGPVLFNLFSSFRESLSKRMIFYTFVMTKMIPNGNLWDKNMLLNVNDYVENNLLTFYIINLWRFSCSSYASM